MIASLVLPKYNLPEIRNPLIIRPTVPLRPIHPHNRIRDTCPLLKMPEILHIQSVLNPRYPRPICRSSLARNDKIEPHHFAACAHSRSLAPVAPTHAVA